MPCATKEKQLAYQRRWMADRRTAWLAANGPCRQCGSWERLEVDHIDPTQKVTHAVWSWSETRRAAELAKCQVLCHRCHLEKTRAQFRRPITHGTRSGYKRGCRCDDCRRVSVAYNKRLTVRNVECGKVRPVFHLPFCEHCDARLSYCGVGRKPRRCASCRANVQAEVGYLERLHALSDEAIAGQADLLVKSRRPVEAA